MGRRLETLSQEVQKWRNVSDEALKEWEESKQESILLKQIAFSGGGEMSHAQKAREMRGLLGMSFSQRLAKAIRALDEGEAERQHDSNEPHDTGKNEK